MLVLGEHILSPTLCNVALFKRAVRVRGRDLIVCFYNIFNDSLKKSLGLMQPQGPF